MEFNIDYTIVMYVFIGIILLYIGISILGTGRTIEGMASKNNNKKPIADILANGDHKQIESYVKKMDDIILVGKYRSDYEDTLISLEEAINQDILANLLTVSSKINSNVGLQNIDTTTISRLNELYKLRDNLSSTMDYVDSKKSSEKSSSFF